jgi:pectinesterase
LKKTLIFLFLFTCFLLAQDKAGPIDTSFALFSTMVKVYKDFPKAKLVVSEIPDSVVEGKNLIYTSYGKREMHLDLYLPHQKSMISKEFYFPVVIMIHGGGWRSGFREMEKPMALYLASKGFICATVEYRLSGEAKYPAAVLDVQRAIKWLKVHYKEYYIDTKKIALYGCSSGGQIAALLGTNNWGHKSDIGTVNAVIDIDGVLDLTDSNESSKDKDPSNPSSGKRWFGYSYDEKPDLWKEGSAINYINGNSASYCFINSSLPRFHAGRDSVINQLDRNKIYSEVYTIANTPHTFWLFHPWFEETGNHIVTFLDKIFNYIL